EGGSVSRRDFRGCLSVRGNCSAVELRFLFAIRSQSRNHLHLCLPESSFLTSRVQNRYLALILAWRNLVERNAEAERHRLQAIIQSLCHLHRSRFKGFRLLLVKTHEGH